MDGYGHRQRFVKVDNSPAFDTADGLAGDEVDIILNAIYCGTFQGDVEQPSMPSVLWRIGSKQHVAAIEHNGSSSHGFLAKVRQYRRDSLGSQR